MSTKQEENQNKSARRVFKQALAAVRRSGIAPELELKIRGTQGGRPRRLSVEMLLAASITATNTEFRNATHVRIHRILTSTLSASYRLRNDLTWLPPGKHGKKDRHSLTIRQVRHLFNQIVRVLDYSPHTSGLGEEDRIDTEEQTYQYLNRLVRASFPTALPSAKYQAIDATSYESWSRPGSKNNAPQPTEDYRLDKSAFARQDHGAWDHDARWGHQTETHANGDEIFFGHKTINSVASYCTGSPFQTLKVITAMYVMPNGAYEPDVTIRMIDEYLTPYHNGFTVLTDRGFSNASTDRWAEQLLARGIDQFMDMNPSDLTTSLDPATGALIFAGWPFLPWTPKELFNITRPVKFSANEPPRGAAPGRHRSYARRIAKIQEFRDAIAALAPYALVPNGRRDALGNQRFFIPQHDRARATPQQRNRRVFTQSTVRIKYATMAKHQQPARWGTDEWIRTYSYRTAVEGVFGNLKSRDGEGMTRGWIRVVGLPAMALMAALAMVHYNLRIVTTWAHANKIEVKAIYAANTTNELLNLIEGNRRVEANAPPRAA